MLTPLRRWLRIRAAPSLLVFALISPVAAGELSEYRRITSSYLGYDLQYRVYRPTSVSNDKKLPTLYVTDGDAYLRFGDFKSVLDRSIADGQSLPVIVVFVDSRDPDAPDASRRNQEFMCNGRYARFFSHELIPAVSATEPVSPLRDERVVMGFSFGGINAACFGIALSDVFSGVAMQSPGSSDHVDVIRSLYEERERLPLKFFISVGTQNDNLRATKRFANALRKKGYELTFVRVGQGHDWDNWGPLIDEVLETFFSGPESRQ